MTKQETFEAAALGKGCLGKAADDEPVFVLRSQDRLAAGIVDEWADRAEAHGCSAAKVQEARDLANQMRSWPTRKYPD